MRINFISGKGMNIFPTTSTAATNIAYHYDNNSDNNNRNN
jgi:hypothetical protein